MPSPDGGLGPSASEPSEDWSNGKCRVGLIGGVQSGGATNCSLGFLWQDGGVGAAIGMGGRGSGDRG